MGAQPDDLDAVMAQYGELQHAYQDAGGYDLESRAREALGGLGLDDELQGRDPRQLSGGQKRRVELSKLLLADADLLLIDEPTNHLDLASIEWLEEFMAEVRSTFVLVSHDRRFLDRVCTSVLELGHGVAEEYPGNYTQYVRLRGERRARRQKEFESQQAHISHQEEFIRKYKAGQRAKEARGRQKQLDRIERVSAPPRDRRPRLRFATAPVSQILLKTSELEVGRAGRRCCGCVRSASRPVSASPSSGPTAAASRRCCTPWRASCHRSRATSGSGRAPIAACTGRTSVARATRLRPARTPPTTRARSWRTCSPITPWERSAPAPCSARCSSAATTCTSWSAS